MTDMDKITMRDYAKRCGVTYECVRRTVNKELKNNPVFEKYVHKLGRTTYLDSRAILIRVVEETRLVTHKK